MYTITVQVADIFRSMMRKLLIRRQYSELMIVTPYKWEICCTLKANMETYLDRVPIIRDDFGIRKLTPMECLAFQGYPKNYTFNGISLEGAYKQCGNTVCVPIIKQLANIITRIII